MSFLANIFRRRPDARAELKPLWRAVIAIARRPDWYAECGVADTQEGRFDMLTAALATVIVRMEREEELHAVTALLTELFVEDIEGQLRQQGIGDPTLGKRMGKIMSVLGGRIGAYRAALAQPDDALLAEAAVRNVTFGEGGRPECVAQRLRLLDGELREVSAQGMIEAEFVR